MEKAGLPKGVINLVTGPGDIVGSAICEHPKIDGICFTGETKTGEEITKRAGVKKIILELGGLGPLIVLDDANLNTAAQDAVFGCYYNAGQVCVANERILVHEKVHDDFVRKTLALARKVKLGFPLNEDVDVGPINNEPQVRKVETHIKDAIEKGAKLLLGGKRAVGFPTNLYFEPTVIDNVTPDMLFNKEETFGPVIPIMTFSSLDEAIDIANSTQYGLSSAVHTRSLKKAFYLAERIKTGQVVINDSVCTWEYQHPWGGMKKSGIGRMGGKYTVWEMTDVKTIMLNLEKTDF
jgi:acyl-CoA reductase-like NAD-dependent aldehyde dehydrogenase